jgi:hypothetical protein
LGNGIHWILPKNIGSRIPVVVFPLAKYWYVYLILYNVLDSQYSIYSIT